MNQEAQKIVDEIFKPVIESIKKNHLDKKGQVYDLPDAEFNEEIKKQLKPEQLKDFNEIKELFDKKAYKENIFLEPPLFEFIKKVKKWWQGR